MTSVGNGEDVKGELLRSCNLQESRWDEPLSYEETERSSDNMADQERLCIVVNVPLKIQDAMRFFGRGRSTGWPHVVDPKSLAQGLAMKRRCVRTLTQSQYTSPDLNLPSSSYSCSLDLASPLRA